MCLRPVLLPPSSSPLPQPIGPFGTAENPVEVESIFEERIMGCPGDCAGGDTRANNEVRCVHALPFFV